MHYPANNAVALQVTQLLDKHLLSDPGNRTLQFAKSKCSSPKEFRQDRKLPSPLKNLQCLLDASRRNPRRDARIHAFLSFLFVFAIHFDTDKSDALLDQLRSEEWNSIHTFL